MKNITNLILITGLVILSCWALLTIWVESTGPERLTFCLWRPNDKARMKEANTAVAIYMGKKWTGEIVQQLN